MQEIQVQSWSQEDLLKRKWQPTPVFLPEKSHRQRNLVGYSPKEHKESDTTERLNMYAESTLLLPLFYGTSQSA